MKMNFDTLIGKLADIDDFDDYREKTGINIDELGVENFWITFGDLSFKARKYHAQKRGGGDFYTHFEATITHPSIRTYIKFYKSIEITRCYEIIIESADDIEAINGINDLINSEELKKIYSGYERALKDVKDAISALNWNFRYILKADGKFDLSRIDGYENVKEDIIEINKKLRRTNDPEIRNILKVEKNEKRKELNEMEHREFGDYILILAKGDDIRRIREDVGKTYPNSELIDHE